MIDFLIFLFTYLPGIFVHIILGIGVIGLVCSFFFSGILEKLMPVQKVLIKHLSMLMFVVGLFLEGGLAVNDEYMRRAKEWENKVILAEERAKAVNEKIEYVYLDKVREVEKTRYIVKDKIVRVADTLDKECLVTPAMIDILNEAAKR